MLGRLIGWALVFAGSMVLAAGAMRWINEGVWNVLATGELWFQVSAESLTAAQDLAYHYLHPAIWDVGVQTILLWPAYLVLIVPGLLLLWTCRPRPVVE